MSKVITKCTDCPHLSHTGVFTKGGARPCCNHKLIMQKKEYSCFEGIIPYKLVYSSREGSYTLIIKRIPEWCPLKYNN